MLAPGDISQESFARELFRTTVSELGGVDLIANVAGKQVFVEDLADLSSEQFELTFKTHVYALFSVVQETLPHLPAGAAIINTSSIQAYSPSPGLVDYATTKAASNARAMPSRPNWPRPTSTWSRPSPVTSPGER